MDDKTELLRERIERVMETRQPSIHPITGEIDRWYRTVQWKQLQHITDDILKMINSGYKFINEAK